MNKHFFHYRICFGERNIDWNWMHFIYSYYEIGNSLLGRRLNPIEGKKVLFTHATQIPLDAL